MARQADAILFGPEAVSAGAADSYWDEVEVTSAALLSSLGRFDRWKARVNLASFGVSDRIEGEFARLKRHATSAGARFRLWLGRVTG